MPKVKKEKSKKGKKSAKKQRSKELEEKTKELKKAQLKKNMFTSSLVTWAVALVFFIISLIFNGRFYTLPHVGEETAWTVFDVLIKSFAIIFFFFFLFVSVGNYQELRGYILTWKEMTVIVLVALLQASTEGYVFLVSLIGVILVITYFYFIQGRIEKQ